MTKRKPAWHALMVELLPDAKSLREIAAMLGVQHRQLAIEARPIIDAMKAAGTLPPCPCGRERFHQYGCGANRVGGIQRREAIVEMLRAGDSYYQIAEVFGLERTTVRHYLDYLSPAEIEARLALDLARGSQAATPASLERRRERSAQAHTRRRRAA